MTATELNLYIKKKLEQIGSRLKVEYTTEIDAECVRVILTQCTIPELNEAILIVQDIFDINFNFDINTLKYKNDRNRYYLTINNSDILTSFRKKGLLELLS